MFHLYAADTYGPDPTQVQQSNCGAIGGARNKGTFVKD